MAGSGQFSRLGKTRALNAVLGLSAPSTYTGYIALTTTAPTDSTIGTEYGATGYARQAVTFGSPTAADPPVSSTTGTLTFGPFTAGTGATIAYAELTDQSAGAITATTQMYMWWTFGTSKTPASGDSATIATAALTASFTV